jgi:hypothetical protein
LSLVVHFDFPCCFDVLLFLASVFARQLGNLGPPSSLVVPFDFLRYFDVLLFLASAFARQVGDLGPSSWGFDGLFLLWFLSAHLCWRWAEESSFGHFVYCYCSSWVKKRKHFV